METTIETNTNEEIKVLRIKLEVVEKELECALNRAELAESEVDLLKARLGGCETGSICSRCGCDVAAAVATAAASGTTTAAQPPPAPSLPPPPPPPMPQSQLHVGTFSNSVTSLQDAISGFALNNMRQIDDPASQPMQATGEYPFPICRQRHTANKTNTSRLLRSHCSNCVCL